MTRLSFLLTLLFGLFFSTLIFVVGFLNNLNLYHLWENTASAFFVFSLFGFILGGILDIFMLGKFSLVSEIFTLMGHKNGKIP